jgi:hypothetical protein
MLSQNELHLLSRRSFIIWDVIDRLPRFNGIGHFIFGSLFAMGLHQVGCGSTVIRHHHCNRLGVINSDITKPVAWLGYQHWCPDIDVPFEKFAFPVNAPMLQEEVIRAYQGMGISLNFRRSCPQSPRHVSLNSGIKLINSIGFGVPSLSALEPAYTEIGEGCTIFCQPSAIGENLTALKSDKQRYRAIRDRCILKASDFSLHTISRKYIELIKSV